MLKSVKTARRQLTPVARLNEVSTRCADFYSNKSFTSSLNWGTGIKTNFNIQGTMSNRFWLKLRKKTNKKQKQKQKNSSAKITLQPVLVFNSASGFLVFRNQFATMS